MEAGGQLSATQSKTVLGALLERGGDPAALAKEMGFEALGSDTLSAVLDEIIAAHPDEWARYVGGEDKLTGLFTGAVMKATSGKANGKEVAAELRRRRGYRLSSRAQAVVPGAQAIQNLTFDVRRMVLVTDIGVDMRTGLVTATADCTRADRSCRSRSRDRTGVSAPRTEVDGVSHVTILDHAPTREIRQKYTDLGLDQATVDIIEEVDYVWTGGSYQTVPGLEPPFDWIVASHVIEHTTDLIGFLLDLAGLLAPSGRLVRRHPGQASTPTTTTGRSRRRGRSWTPT